MLINTDWKSWLKMPVFFYKCFESSSSS